MLEMDDYEPSDESRDADGLSVSNNGEWWQMKENQDRSYQSYQGQVRVKGYEIQTCEVCRVVLKPLPLVKNSIPTHPIICSCQELLQLGTGALCQDEPVPSTEDLADQILELLNFFGLGEVMCMGVTAGAYTLTLLTLFALKYRERVLGLILVSPLCKGPSWTEWLYNKVMSNLLYFYGICGLVKDCLLKRYFSKVL